MIRLRASCWGRWSVLVPSIILLVHWHRRRALRDCASRGRWNGVRSCIFVQASSRWMSRRCRLPWRQKSVFVCKKERRGERGIVRRSMQVGQTDTTQPQKKNRSFFFFDALRKIFHGNTKASKVAQSGKEHIGLLPVVKSRPPKKVTFYYASPPYHQGEQKKLSPPM